jgi:hypothetical protein
MVRNNHRKTVEVLEMKRIWRKIKDITMFLVYFSVVIFAAIVICFIKVIEVLKIVMEQLLLKLEF